MDDRYNICDICGQDIFEEDWSMKDKCMVQTGQAEVETPSFVPTKCWSDGYCHKACLDKFQWSDFSI